MDDQHSQNPKNALIAAIENDDGSLVINCILQNRFYLHRFEMMHRRKHGSNTFQIGRDICSVNGTVIKSYLTIGFLLQVFVGFNIWEFISKGETNILS